MPTADVDEYRRLEVDRGRLLREVASLGYQRWLVTYYPPYRDSDWCGQYVIWPQDVAEAPDDEWERLFKARSFDADLIARTLARKGFDAKAQRSAGLPYVRVLGGQGDAPPWPVESEETFVSDRLRDRLDVVPLSEVEGAAN